MDFDDLLAAVNMAVADMEAQPEDAHEVHMRLRELLDQIKATGMPLPADLMELERRLEHDVEGVD